MSNSRSAGAAGAAGEWRRVCDESDVSQDGLYAFDVGLAPAQAGEQAGEQEGEQAPLTLPLLVHRRGEELSALHDECPHRRVKISSRGYIKDDLVFCGWHHWGFHLRTGAHMIPTGICVPTYPLALRDGALWVMLS